MSKAAELANLIGNINAGGGGVNRNLLDNGAMNLSQRGTSLSMAHDNVSNAFLLDRFQFYMAGGFDEFDGTSAQVADDPLGGVGNAFKWTTGTAESAIAAAEYVYFTQKIEAQNLQHIQNGNSNAKPLTLSFYVKSSITGTFSVGLFKPDNTTRIHNKTYTINLANTWEKKTVTFAGDTSGGGINDDNGQGLWVSWHLAAGSDFKGGGSTSGWTDYANTKWADGLATDAVVTTAGATWLMTQCQLEVGQNPTEFEHINNFGEELARCQRYFYKETYPDAPNRYGPFFCQYTPDYRFVHQWHPVTMRAVPTSTFVSNQSSTEFHSNNSVFKSYTAYNSSSDTSVYLTAYQADAEL